MAPPSMSAWRCYNASQTRSRDFPSGSPIAGCSSISRAKPEGITLTQWLYDEIRGAILAGKLKRAWALPATRQLAQTAGVSRHIVVNVYEQLTAEGYLEGKIGRGTFVPTEILDDFLVRPVLQMFEERGLDHGKANADAAFVANPHEARFRLK